MNRDILEKGDASRAPQQVLKLRANGRIIVECYMLRSFAQLGCMLLHVVESCCAKFETESYVYDYVQRDATTPNIVGPKMLRAVAFIYS